MIFTTRDPREADRFVNSLPFSDEEKAQIKTFFPTIEELMVQMKKNKGFNSKGGERWFVGRLQTKVQNAMENIEDRPGVSPIVLQFLASQIACMEETMAIVKECDCDDDLTGNLRLFVQLLEQIWAKYTDSNQDDDTNEDFN